MDQIRLHNEEAQLKMVNFGLSKLPYLASRDGVVLHRARERYKSVVERFFRENRNVLAPHEKETCLNDVRNFMSLRLTAEDHYYINGHTGYAGDRDKWILKTWNGAWLWQSGCRRI